MRQAARTDTNQSEIVAALRAAGCSIQLLHEVGGGCPDALCGRAGSNYLLEIKAGKGKLSALQLDWHLSWRGQVAVVRTPEEALAACGIRVEEGA